MALLAVVLAASPAPAAGPYPDAAGVVSAFMTVRHWVDRFDVPPPDDPASSVPIDDAAGVCVILRQGGRVIGTGTDTVADDGMVRRAASRAMGVVLGDPAVAALPPGQVADIGRAITLQLEVAGAPTPLVGRTFEAIAGQLDPGLDGVAIRRGEQLAMLFPAQVRANNTAGRMERLLPALAVDVGLSVMPLPELARRFDVTMYRFRTTDLAQATPDAPPFATVRGDLVLIDEDVTRASIETLARGIADHLAASMAPIDQPVGLLGTYLPASDRHDPLIAPPLEQALAAWALARYAAMPGLDGPTADGAAAMAARILDQLAVVTPVEIDPLADTAACAAIVQAALEHPTYLTGAKPPALFADAVERVRAGWTDEDPPHARALIASATCRLLAAGRGGVGDADARRVLDAAWASVPPNRQVALLPWIAWGEADYAAATARPMDATRFRELRALLDASRIDAVTRGDDPDLAGGFELDSRHEGLATSQTLRPAAALAWMIGRADLTPPAETTLALDRMLKTMRFVMQLSVRDPLLWACPDPARARGGIRGATWDWDQPVPAQALALATAVEMIRCLDLAKGDGQGPPSRPSEGRTPP